MTEKELFEDKMYSTLQQIDGAYINALVDLVIECRKNKVKINTVQAYEGGWRVTFEQYNGDAICHDASYGSPYNSFPKKNHYNDWNISGFWETIGFPWDNNDVSVHSAEELAFYLRALNEKDSYIYFKLPMPWEEV